MRIERKSFDLHYKLSITRIFIACPVVVADSIAPSAWHIKGEKKIYHTIRPRIRPVGDSGVTIYDGYNNNIIKNRVRDVR